MINVQIDDEVRPATEEELVKLTNQSELIAAQKLEEDRIAAEKAEAKTALLERLGITEDEAKLLLA
jgi:hypothetical protein